jgi:CyaY protein
MSDIAERDFERAADATLHALDRALADEHELEVELAMGILTIELADATKIVINSHRAARQIWMAADRTAWHFDPVAGLDEARGGAARWVAAKTGDELVATLEAVVSRKLGRPFSIAR